MKKNEAYIQPFMLDKVEDALREIRIHGMSIFEAKGFGRQKDESYPHHAVDNVADFTPKIKIEIICSDADSERILETIRKAAHTGRRGDGKIVIYEALDAVNIRTGERGQKVIE